MTTNNIVMERIIKLKANNVQHEINVRMDFEDVSKSQLLAWAFADRIIAMQRALRECNNETLNELSTDGYHVHALTAGMKPRTTAEVLADVKAALAALSPAERQIAIEQLMDEK